MNVRTIALAITLIVPAATAFGAEGVPYAGPNKPVTTTASNDVVTEVGRSMGSDYDILEWPLYSWRNTSGNGTALQAMKETPVNKDIYGWRNTASKDTTLQAMQYAPTDKALEAAAKDKTLEASKDAPINTPTAN
jgi:hypothetical protein